MPTATPTLPQTVPAPKIKTGLKSPEINDHLLKSCTVALVGYGNQGRPQALNLKDSGHQVLVGLRPGSTHWQNVIQDGLTPIHLEEVTAQADVVMMMLPDEQIPTVFEQLFPPTAPPQKARYVGFAHGLAIHAKWVTPADWLNVFLVAPKAQGRGVRNKFLQDSGVPALVAVHQDPAGNTLEMAHAYAAALGCGRAGVFPTTFRDETECDLFTEQVLLCGGLTGMIKAAYETLMEQGYDPQTAWFECVYEVKLLADLIHEKGLTGMREAISPAARYGDLTQGHRVIDAHVKENMRRVLSDIQSQQFTNALKHEAACGYPETRERLTQDYHHPVEQTYRQMQQYL